MTVTIYSGAPPRNIPSHLTYLGGTGYATGQHVVIENALYDRIRKWRSLSTTTAIEVSINHNLFELVESRYHQMLLVMLPRDIRDLIAQGAVTQDEALAAVEVQLSELTGRT